MTLGVNDEEVLGWGNGRRSYLFPKWTSGDFDEYFRWLANFPDIKVLRFVYGVDFGDGPQFATGLSELCDAATRAGVKLIPQLMHPGNAQKTSYALGGSKYGSLVTMERSTMANVQHPAILMWDLFNEMDVNGPFVGPLPYSLWVRTLVADVRSSTTKPLTVGHQGFGGGLWTFWQMTFNLMNDVPGMDVAHVHWYGPDPNPSNTIGNYLGAWAKAIGKPCLAGEFGSNQRYWPEFVPLWTAGDALAMYLDGYPGYPPPGPVDAIPRPPPPIPGPSPSVELDAIRTRLDALETKSRLHTHGPPL